MSTNLPAVKHPELGIVRIDADALLRMAHRCVPGKCEGRRSCCASYEVVLKRDEVSKVAGAMPLASAYAPHLLDDDGNIDNVFEEVDRGQYALETDEDGLCRFAYRNDDGVQLCSLHSVALDLDMLPHHVKPTSCALWPLALSEGRVPILSTQGDAFLFACNRRRSKGCRSLHAGVAATIAECFGGPFLQQVNELITARTGSATSPSPATTRAQ